MVAVVCQQVIAWSEELVADFFYDALDFGRGVEGEALQDADAVCASRRLVFRSRVVDACDTAFVVAAICIFAIVDYNSRVEEATADRPE